MQRAYEYKLYPTTEQACSLLDVLETLRHLYNNALAERIDAYRHEQRSLGYVEQANQLPALKSKIGNIPVRLHRPLQGTPKTCTIRHQADGWYASIVCKVEPEPLPATGQEVGIDVGIEHFATFTDDHAPIADPRPLQKAQASLRKAQRRLERRTKRDKNRKMLAKQSKRREKAKVLLAKAHLHVTRARRDFQHKLAHTLVRQFDTFYIENLNIKAMLTNHHLAKSIADAGWAEFFLVLKAKAESAVKTVVEVCPRNTSQNCSCCGEYVPKALSVRSHSCPYCGLVLHRDKNAAENIRNAGRLVLSAQWAGTPPSDDNVGATRPSVA